MTPAQANLLRATALLSQVPASGVLREGVREALAVVDAETARGLNAPRRFCDTVAARAAIDPAFREEIEAAQPVGLFAQIMPEQQRQALEYRGDELIGPRCGPAPVDTVVAEVRADLLARSERGIAKYGVTLDRTDLGLREWMVHFREELMDGVLYATRAMREIAKEGDPWPERYAAAVAVLQTERDRLRVMMANAAPTEPPHAAAPDVARIEAFARHEALRDVHRVAHMTGGDAPDYAGAVLSLLRGATEALQAAAPVLAPLAPEPTEAVLGRAGEAMGAHPLPYSAMQPGWTPPPGVLKAPSGEALAWDGRQPPVHVPFEPGAPHPYGDDAYQMTTDGVARMFPSREAAHRWLVAMGKAL